MNAAETLPAGCDVPYGCWCPGQPLPKTNGPLPWDMNSCHNYHYLVLGGHGYLIPPPLRQVLTGLRTWPQDRSGS